MGSIPGRGTEIPQAARRAHPNPKNSRRNYCPTQDVHMARVDKQLLNKKEEDKEEAFLSFLQQDAERLRDASNGHS